MTFTEIVDEICDRLNLTSTTATARVGRLVNICYRQITSSIGLNTARRTEVQADATIGSQLLTFSGIEKVISVIDKSSGSNRFLDEVTVDELDRSPIADSDTPTKYAIYRTNAATVQIKLNVVPQTAFTLYAPGIVETATLSGTQEPAFPESYHDILVSGVLAEEYMKLEKGSLSRREQMKFEDRLGDLRIFIAKSPQQDIYQGKLAGSTIPGVSSSAGGGSGASTGATSYTQTGLITFDRTSAAVGSRYPFAVATGSEKVANLDADLLDGLDSTAFRLASVALVNADISATAAIAYSKLNLATSIVNADINAAAAIAYSKLNLATSIVNADIAVAAAIAWTKISKTGSSLADLTTRSAADLSSGIIPDARVPGFTSDGVSRITQLAFKAAQSASTDANTLDDYEEGTWTPAVTGSGGGSGQTYTIQTGHYVKIGKLVFCTFNITLSAKGTITTTAIISGLPFASDSGVTQTFQIRFAALTTSWANVIGAIASGASTIALNGNTAAAVSNAADLVSGDLSNTSVLQASFTYRASA